MSEITKTCTPAEAEATAAALGMVYDRENQVLVFPGSVDFLPYYPNIRVVASEPVILTGSEAQVEWATRLKAKALETLRAYRVVQVDRATTMIARGKAIKNYVEYMEEMDAIERRIEGLTSAAEIIDDLRNFSEGDLHDAIVDAVKCRLKTI